MSTPRASICIAAFNKPTLLKNTLLSIYSQTVPFEYEVIVVDDGSADDRIRRVCSKFSKLRYHRIERPPVYRNPCTARNLSYQMAESDILICQSDEVLHVTPNAIEGLVRELKPGTFVLANVFCLSKRGQICGEYTGPCRQAPYFFLGSIFREDMFAVGCNDEEFAICPAYEDAWLGHCLINGRGLKPVYTTLVKGHHQWHEYVSSPATEAPSRDLYNKKVELATKGLIPWQAASGPWPFIPASKEVPVVVEQVFTDIYKENHWGSNESKSGAGSTKNSTKLVRSGLEEILKKYNIKTMLDIPCGDFNWMQHVDLSGVDYIGCDVVNELVKNNRQKYSSETRKFEHLNVITSPLPQADLIFCRDCLGHFSQTDAKQALLNMSRSGTEWLLTTTFPNHKFNKPIRTGQWTTINLEEPPFSLPPPLELINEDCQEWYPHFNDKNLALWRFQDIEPFNSITVCVDYDDFLAITLPRNKRHFKRTLVVTAPHDIRTQQLCASLEVECYVTDVFYKNGAAFNKGAAMEEGFEILGREGWICIWDADIVMPNCIRQPLDLQGLHTPARKILADPSKFSDDLDWDSLPSPTQPCEFDGYFQLFHASSVKPPWYSTDWSHAGGCDSDFQFKYTDKHKHRSPFCVLHLGEEGTPGVAARIGRNWRGRTLPRIDTGEVLACAETRLSEVTHMVKARKMYGTGPEKIHPPVLNNVNRLPKRMCYFWTGPMSWLRYLTLKSFRHYNPDWVIDLYKPVNLTPKRQWKTGEQDDAQRYKGQDWSTAVAELGIIQKSWKCPLPNASPAQASDLFQWQLLSGERCFYADMDILWTAPLEPVRESVCTSDAVFCLESGVLAIGFFGSNKFEFFNELYKLAMKSSRLLKHYQGCGTELIYDMLQISSNNVGSGRAGRMAMQKLKKYYPASNIVEVPDQTVYPFDWRQIDDIFNKLVPLPEGTAGIHWFGGSNIAQHWNNVLTSDTWQDYSSTITAAIERMLP